MWCLMGSYLTRFMVDLLSGRVESERQDHDILWHSKLHRTRGAAWRGLWYLCTGAALYNTELLAARIFSVIYVLIVDQ